MTYERVNWENLPSTKTPINQTNLNKMENGIDQAGAEIFVGTEEPVAGEKVWFRKGKNKFNPNDKTKGYLNTDGSFTSATDWMCSGFIEINSDKYILSANTTATRVIWCEYDSSMDIIGTRHEVVYGNPIAIVSTNTKYIRVCFNDNTATDIQLEQGTTVATSYEAYIEPKIFVRNSNGVYEEFINKHEEEIVLYENTSGLASGGADILKKSVSKYKILGVYTSTGYEIIYYGGLNKNCWGNKTALYFFNNGNAFNVYNTTLYKIVALY